jgi:hypothetical protein
MLASEAIFNQQVDVYEMKKRISEYQQAKELLSNWEEGAQLDVLCNIRDKYNRASKRLHEMSALTVDDLPDIPQYVDVQLSTTNNTNVNVMGREQKTIWFETLKSQFPNNLDIFEKNKNMLDKKIFMEDNKFKDKFDKLENFALKIRSLGFENFTKEIGEIENLNEFLAKYETLLTEYDKEFDEINAYLKDIIQNSDWKKKAKLQTQKNSDNFEQNKFFFELLTKVHTKYDSLLYVEIVIARLHELEVCANRAKNLEVKASLEKSYEVNITKFKNEYETFTREYNKKLNEVNEDLKLLIEKSRIEKNNNSNKIKISLNQSLIEYIIATRLIVLGIEEKILNSVNSLDEIVLLTNFVREIISSKQLPKLYDKKLETLDELKTKIIQAVAYLLQTSMDIEKIVDIIHLKREMILEILAIIKILSDLEKNSYPKINDFSELPKEHVERLGNMLAATIISLRNKYDK